MSWLRRNKKKVLFRVTEDERKEMSNFHNQMVSLFKEKSIISTKEDKWWDKIENKYKTGNKSLNFDPETGEIYILK